MRDEIVDQGPGYTIARSSIPSGVVPYFPGERPDGNVNHDWFDLRGQPRRVVLIPEATRSPGLSAMLRAVADPQSQLMSAACDCPAFNRGIEDPKWQVGGFVTVMYQDGDRNVDSNKLIELARLILHRTHVDTLHWTGFQFTVEPINIFFGRIDCHELLVKPVGYGNDEATAWAAFEEAAQATAEALVHVAQMPVPGRTGTR
jgi:hypothetical protein